MVLTETGLAKVFQRVRSFVASQLNSKNVLVFTKRAENVKTVSCSQDTTWYIDNNNLYGCGYNSGNTMN